MACFADVNVSQGSVATYARCGGIFDIRLTANLPRNLPVKKFRQSAKNWQNYGHASVTQFFWPTLYIYISALETASPGNRHCVSIVVSVSVR